MNIWIAGKNLKKPKFPDKKAFYSELNLDDISDKYYLHSQEVWDVFEINDIGDYHDLYVQNDTLLLADVFQNFRNKCAEIYGLDPPYFLPAAGKLILKKM